MASASTNIGKIVWTGDERGFGKIVEQHDKLCEVEFFFSVQKREHHQYQAKDLRPVRLSNQTRVYIPGPDYSWRVGRIVDSFPDPTTSNLRYDVRFPNDLEDAFEENEFFVRCGQPVADPAGILAALGAETAFLQDRRIATNQAILKMRAGSHGLTGLISSSIELVPHQIEVVRRVLQDPVQRYLLSDEVGLGKTIEAGCIIRQCLIDTETGWVTVLAPAPLVLQWEWELRTKFAIDDFPGRVRVLPFEALENLPDRGELLVVDEVHRLIGKSPSTYSSLASLAQSAPRLLLLTATPVLSDDAQTLALLHLLDPVAYSLDDSQSFHEKSSRRQEIGRFLLGLEPNAPGFLLRQIGEKLLLTLPDDPVIAELAPMLATAEVANRTETVRRLSRHIAETYRLHHRLLRNRRKDLDGWELLPRKSELSEPEVDFDDESLPDLVQLLESWRYQSRSALLSEPTTDFPLERQFADRYARLFEALGVSPAELISELERQEQAIGRDELPTFADESGIIGDLKAAGPSSVAGSKSELAQTMLHLMIGALKAKGIDHPKLVAFTSSTTFAHELRRQLETTALTKHTALVTQEMTHQEAENELARFRTDDWIGVLVTDHAGEEGLNLQFAHGIAHLDLPLDPGRLEQRLGRLDRFGRTQTSMFQRVILPSDEDESPWLAWLDLVREGFDLFDHSISDVQFLLQELQTDVVLGLYRGGATGLRELTDIFKVKIAEERVRLDEQYALDRLNITQTTTLSVYESIEHLETDQKQFAGAMDEWMFQTLQLYRGHDSRPGVFKVDWWRDRTQVRTLMPSMPWEAQFARSFKKPMTYDRNIASRYPDVALVRPGSPLIETMERFLLLDDRGLAAATWRADPNWNEAERGTWLGFRLTYIVEASLALAMGDLPEAWTAYRSEANLRRRADAFLPPYVATIYLDSDLKEVASEDILKILTRPYEDKRGLAGERDFNLSSRYNVLFEHITPERFKELCQAVSTFAEQQVRTGLTFTTTVSHAAAIARDALDLINDGLAKRRLALERQGSDDPSLGREIAINEVIIKAVSGASIKLDTIGFFMISKSAPEDTV